MIGGASTNRSSCQKTMQYKTQTRLTHTKYKHINKNESMHSEMGPM